MKLYKVTFAIKKGLPQGKETLHEYITPASNPKEAGQICKYYVHKNKNCNAFVRKINVLKEG